MNLRSWTLLTTCLVAFAFAPGLIRAQYAPLNDTSSIIASIHEEKDAYLALDATRLASVWIQQPSSLKLYMFEGKEERHEGYAAIGQHDRANLDRERTLPPNQRSRFSFSDFRVTQQGDSAWVTCHVRWDGYAGPSPAFGHQTRIYVLRWEQGRWKIALLAIAQLASPPSPDTPASVQLPSSPSLLTTP